MSEVYVIVEGKTEELFVQRILAPALAMKGVYLYPTQVSKPGQKGGDVRFNRVEKDIRNHLRQRQDTLVATFLDYYGLKDWPGMDRAALAGRPPEEIARRLSSETISALKRKHPDLDFRRFIPFIIIHEFEALLFSDADVLARYLGVSRDTVFEVIRRCGGPECINNNPSTAPSKRLEGWMERYKKTVTGIVIAEEIGLDKIREKCPVFNSWVSELESREF